MLNLTKFSQNHTLRSTSCYLHLIHYTGFQVDMAWIYNLHQITLILTCIFSMFGCFSLEKKEIAKLQQFYNRNVRNYQ